MKDHAQNSVPATDAGSRQLVSYIALAAPATRRPATGSEPFMRPEIGFTPRWFHVALGIDFGELWHRDPRYRRDSIRKMSREIRSRFGQAPIGIWQDPDNPQDLLTGTYGACLVAALYGAGIEYSIDNWPWSRHAPLSDEDLCGLHPPNLDSSPLFEELLTQVEWISRENGLVTGFINWQGVLNNAYRIRGEELFVDLIAAPDRARHLFACVSETMIEGARRLYSVQRQSGVDIRHFTVSNCLVNLISPDQYRNLLFPFDRKISEAFGLIGVHNCAWRADPYIEHYAQLPNVQYIDMGMESDLSLARETFPNSRRAIMYAPTDLVQKAPQEIRSDLVRIAEHYGPCDVVFADIESGTPDERVLDLIRFCEEISNSR